MQDVINKQPARSSADSPTATLRVVCFGAAGPKAGLVLPQLAKRGVQIRAFIHDEHARSEVLNDGAHDIVVGNLAVSDQVDAAVADMDAAFYIAPNGMQDEAAVGVAFVEAAKRADVRRIVFSSIMAPSVAIPMHLAKGTVEDAIRRSGLEFAVLQPAMFYQNIGSSWDDIVKTGEYAEPWANEARLCRVDYRDIAECAAIALIEDTLLNGTFELCAEPGLTRTEIAAVIGELVRKSVTAKELDSEKIASSAGPYAPILKSMFEFYGQYGLHGNTLTLRTILGRNPRSLRDYLIELRDGSYASV